MTDTLDLIQQGIDAMFDPTDIVEVRVPKAGKAGTISGYFEASSPELAKTFQKLSGQHDGIYVTLNPCKPALLNRAVNRVKSRANVTTSDHDILHRYHLLIDIDPVRPAGVSATDDEISHARKVSRAVFKYLKDLGWAEPLVAESGNGFHLIYNIDLDNTPENSALVKNVLGILSAQFDNEFAKVDTSVFNAARIVKAYGTLAAKGDSTPDRPHRIAKVLRCSDGLVTAEQLQKLAPQEAVTPPTITGTHKYAGSSPDIEPERVTEFLEFHSIGYQEPVAGTKPNQWKWVLDNCIFNPDHAGKDAAVFLTNGALGYRCLHNSCTDNHWKEFRAQAEVTSGKKFYFHDGSSSGTVGVGVWDEASARLEADIASMNSTPSFPDLCLEGSYIGDLAKALTESTFVPPVFVYNHIKAALGLVLDGCVGFPFQPAMSMRNYVMNVSAGPQCGKGESRIRVYGMDAQGGRGVLHPILMKHGAFLTDGNEFGSGQALKKYLAEQCSGRRVLMSFEEMQELYSKCKGTGNILEAVLLQLFDSLEVGQTTVGAGPQKGTNVRFNVTGDFTIDGFRRSFEGSSSVGNGLLSRCVFSLSDRLPYFGDWKLWNPADFDSIVAKIAAVVDHIKAPTGEIQNLFVPEEDPIAKQLRNDFLLKIGQSEEFTPFIDRMDVHFKKDLLLRALFSNNDDIYITPDHVAQSIKWTEYQLLCRRKLWQAEGKDFVACMNIKIMEVLNKHKNVQTGISAAKLCTLCNVYRDGSQHHFERALRALIHGSGDVVIAGVNREGFKIYALRAQ